MDMDIVDMDMDMDMPLFLQVFAHVSRVVSRLQVQLDASPAAARARAQEHRRTAGPHARLPRERTRKHNSPCVYKKVVNCVSLSAG